MMLDTRLFGEELKSLGFNFFTGVPCSFLKNLINYAINYCDYIAAVNEGDGTAIAAGAALAGKKAVVLMQNSGLTNAVSPLTSLNYPFRIPVLGFVSLRGDKDLNDEPQHELMGRITEEMLRIMEIKYEYLSQDLKTAGEQLRRANYYIERNKNFFFIIRKNTFNQELLKLDFKANLKSLTARSMKKQNKISHELPLRYQVLEKINSLKDYKTIQIATTGKTGRELYEIEDSCNNLYMVGSMGCAASLGLGLAISRPQNDIVVIDGDGSLLMRMGSLATNGFYKPPNLLHIVLDNGCYDSTGGQKSLADNVDFVEVANASGYPRCIYTHNLEELIQFIKQWKDNRQLTFIYLKIAVGSKENLGRPKLKPFEIAERMKVFLNA